MYVTLDGIPTAAVAGAGWAFTPGVLPHQRDLVFPRSQAQDLVRGATLHGSTLHLVGEGFDETVEKLTILRALAMDNPDLLRVRVADRRWALQYPTFYRVYNKRTRGAAVTRQGVGPRQVRPLDPDVGYHIWSLNSGRAWEPKDVISDVMDACADPWEDGAGVLSKELAPVEDLEAKGKHADAIAQVLSYFGEGIDLWCRKDGTLVLLDRADASELGLVLEGTGTSGERPRAVPSPGWVIQDRSMERPAKVRVLFQPLVELRLDRDETAGAATSGTQTRGAPDPPRLDDVVFLPSDATIDGTDLGPGSIVTLDKFLEWLNGQEPPGTPPLTRDLIRRLWIGDGLNQYVLRDSKVTNLWAGFIPAIRAAWRRQHQLRKAWRDRIRVAIPRRVAVLNPQTGTLGGAAVFSDHAIEHTWRNPTGRRQDDLREAHEQVRNVFAAGSSGPNNVIATNLRDLRQAPAEVTVKDQDQKVLVVDFRLSTEGDTERVFRCAVEQSRMPTTLIGDGDAYVSQEDAWLQEEWEQSIVISAVMAAPNDKRIFWPVEVEPSEVRDQIKHKIEPARGPVLEVLVSGARIPARFAWDDDRASLIAACFSEGSTVAGAQDQGVGLLDAYDGPVNQEQLEAMAKAIAASVYLQLSDRPVGGLRTPVVDLDLKGAAARVALEWDPGHGPVTDILIPEDGLALDPEAFLPSAVRRTIDFFVDPT